ncbi:MAG TPA: hypothetical protein PLY93_02995 [Turneriella sp.]|nr:hypothetical protein [Turneriella sp.]
MQRAVYILTTAAKKTVLGSFLTLFIFSNAVVGIDLTPEIRHDAKTEILSSALVSSSHSFLPNGFHESSSLEIQRLEYNLLRQIMPRHGIERAWHWQINAFDGSRENKILISADYALLCSNLFSLAHTRLDSRYPIPPPTKQNG